jgi:hypothetical protein
MKKKILVSVIPKINLLDLTFDTIANEMKGKDIGITLSNNLVQC